MTAEPQTTPTPVDDRIDPPFMAGERESLESWLELYRSTLPLKIAGLTPEQLCEASTPPSNLTLLGIVRHLTDVERYWFSRVVAGVDRPAVYWSTESADADFDGIEPDHALADLDRYYAEVAQARRDAAAVSDLDAPLPGRRHGNQLNLRWVLIHMIEEYARHLGHADLIRERIDGSTGY